MCWRPAYCVDASGYAARYDDHEVAMSYARLQCVKWRRSHFTEAAVGHFISKERTKDTKVSNNQISELRDLRVLRGECSLTLVLECAKVLLAKAQGDRHE